MLIAVFLIALTAAIVTGMLQINTEQLQLLSNQKSAAKARTIAEAGLNDAFAQLRADDNWDDGFESKSFENGQYTVSLSGSPPEITVQSEAITVDGFSASVDADITLSAATPHTIRVDNLRINE